MTDNEVESLADNEKSPAHREVTVVATPIYTKYYSTGLTRRTVRDALDSLVLVPL